VIIRVRNWEKFQHYRHRAPPWIKLHRSVLDDDTFQALSGDDAKLLINLWLIASECEGAIKTTSTALAWRLRVASTRSVSNGLTRLASALFVTLTDDAGNVLAGCLQDASELLDQSRVEERRVETENNSGRSPFEAFWATYPKRAGANPKGKAREVYAKRVEEGVDVSAILVGTERYAAFCQATKKVGTEWVKQARYWLSPNYRGWEETWELPQDDGDELAFPNYPTDDS